MELRCRREPGQGFRIFGDQKPTINLVVDSVTGNGTPEAAQLSVDGIPGTEQVEVRAGEPITLEGGIQLGLFPGSRSGQYIFSAKAPIPYLVNPMDDNRQEVGYNACQQPVLNS